MSGRRSIDEEKEEGQQQEGRLRRRRKVDATMGDSSGESNPGGELRRRVNGSSRAACGSAHFFPCFFKKTTILYVPMHNSKGGVSLP